MAQGAYVSAPDGVEKVWMWDSVEYRLEAGERRLFPVEVARQAEKFYSPWDEIDGRRESSVLVEEVEGELELVERGAKLFPCTLCGRNDIPEAELTTHILACVQAQGAAAKGGKS